MNTQQVSAKLQGLVEDLIKKEKLVHNAILGVLDADSGFTWSGAVGYSDPTKRTPMQAETPFFLASITKTYTAAVMMILQERGQLALGDKIAKYLPADLIDSIHRFKGTDYTAQLTIRHLLHHTSGLPDFYLDRPKGGKSLNELLFNEGDRGYTRAEAMGMVRAGLTPKFPPATPDPQTGLHLGAKGHYSETNYHLLGGIIEQVTGRPLPEVYEALLFRPLGLTETYFYGHPRSRALTPPAAFFHQDRPLQVPLALQAAGPGGGLISTIADSLRFMQALTQGKCFARKETFAAMQQWNQLFPPFQYGTGLMRFAMPRIFSLFSPSPTLIGHAGSTGSFLFYAKELNIYLAGTVNQTLRQRAPYPLMLKAANIIRKGR